MTSEQQVKNRYTYVEVLMIMECYLIIVRIDRPYLIGIGTSRYKAFTDAMRNLGIKRVNGSGKYQKDKPNKNKKRE